MSSVACAGSLPRPLTLNVAVALVPLKVTVGPLWNVRAAKAVPAIKAIAVNANFAKLDV